MIACDDVVGASLYGCSDVLVVVRIVADIVTGPQVVLLHAYKKQRQKAPAKEIETPERRMEEVLAQGSR